MEYEQKVRKKVWEIFGNSKKVTTFALAIEREIIDAKNGPFVYRLGRKIFILERGVRFPQGLQIKNNKRTKLKISRDGKSQIITKENQTGREEKTS